MSKFIIIVLGLVVVCVIVAILLPVVAGLVVRKLIVSIFWKQAVMPVDKDDGDNVIEGHYRVIDTSDQTNQAQSSLPEGKNIIE